MADLLGQRTCVDQGGTVAAVQTGGPPDSTETPIVTSSVGTFGAAGACSVTPRSPGTSSVGVPLHDDESCVVGGAFRFGLTDQSVTTETVPQRVAVIPTMLVDRYEVTVARWRDRVSRGFSLPADAPLIANDGPLPTSDMSGPAQQTFCTYSDSPLTGAESRETFPITCISYSAARAFCQYEGGDLLTEAEWEYAATATAGGIKTTYPWGYDDPTCSGVVFGRDDVQEDGDTTCTGLGFPFGEEDVTTGTGDVTPSVGLSGMGASVQEWVRDAADPYGSVCWLEQPLLDPVCEDPTAQKLSVRGGSWRYAASSLYSTLRSTLPTAGVAIDVGFRCMRKGT
jgi:formylglycine-generating enzyme required for sulfatase activity